MSSFVVTPISNVMTAFTVSSRAGRENWVRVHLVGEWHHCSTRSETRYALGRRDLCHAVVGSEHDD